MRDLVEVYAWLEGYAYLELSRESYWGFPSLYRAEWF